MDDDLKKLLEAIRQENSAAQEETRRHFDISTESTRKEIRIVAESVAHLTDEMHRGFAALDKKIDSTTAETQAMIKFS